MHANFHTRDSIEASLSSNVVNKSRLSAMRESISKFVCVRHITLKWFSSVRESDNLFLLIGFWLEESDGKYAILVSFILSYHVQDLLLSQCDEYGVDTTIYALINGFGVQDSGLRNCYQDESIPDEHWTRGSIHVPIAWFIIRYYRLKKSDVLPTWKM